jgi:hypothetical protein
MRHILRVILAIVAGVVLVVTLAALAIDISLLGTSKQLFVAANLQALGSRQHTNALMAPREIAEQGDNESPCSA